MQADQLLRFGPYRFDPASGQLWRGTQEVKLTPKALAVLRVLVTRAGHVVTKDELFQTVWSDTVVGDDALTSCIQELRQTLRDDARKPRYLETLHRRGYRFIAPLHSSAPVLSNQFSVSISGKTDKYPPQLITDNWQLTTHLVGREADLTRLHHWLAKALRGERQLVFVTGEPGIGKTTLIESFLHGLAFREHEESQKSHQAEGLRPKAQGTTPLRPFSLQPTAYSLSDSVLSPQSLPSPDPQSQIPNPGVWWSGRGQCIEHYGAGEAYLPVLEALGRLCRESDGQQLIALLQQQAPSWLVQMPALLNPTELEGLQRRTAGVTRERMLRELAEALEVITVERPLVLVLEDLHWSDVSTLDLLSMLARRQERARLLIIGTYRPVEVMVHGHPLKVVKQELQLHGYCHELALDFLSEAAVEEYLVRRTEIGIERKPDRPLTDERTLQGTTGVRQLARMIHRRTDGNPLFMVNVVNHLLSHGVLQQRDGQWVVQHEERMATVLPENLRQLIEQQLARVSSDERKILETASVAGAEFSAAAVAAGVEQSTEVAETHCDNLVRREQFLRAQGTSEWPDGTVAARYGFVHALYQEVLYEQISASRRVRLHRQIGEREEQGYGDRAREIAAELAVHFERGREYRRAIQYLQQAGENAVRRSANQEAITLLTKGLELLKTLPDTPERTQQELTLQIALGAPLRATKGFAAPEVKNAYARARELYQLTGETSQLFPILRGLWEFYELRAEYQTARELGEQLLALAQRQPDPSLRLVAHNVLGNTLIYLGEFRGAREHLEQGIALYDVHQHRSHAFLYGYDSGMHCLSYAALALSLLGYPEQALKKIHAALSLARDFSHPFTFVVALYVASRLHQLRREAQAVQEHAETEMALCTEQGFAFFLAGGTVYRGWALAEQGQGKEGIAQLHRGLAAWRATGTEMQRSHFLALLAEAYGKVGEAEQGLATLVEALAQVEQTGERWYEAELYRQKGELLLNAERGMQNEERQTKKERRGTVPIHHSSLSLPHSEEAETCFLKAIEVARKQQAKSLELRGVVSLARLWQQHGKHKEAHQMLSDIYDWFTEGFDTKDLQEAKALLEELH